jgi:hypothetical protein
LAKADYKKHPTLGTFSLFSYPQSLAFAPIVVDRKHHFEFGTDPMDLTTIAKEAYTAPPPVPLQLSQPEIVFKSSIPIATSTSAFQQKLENNFMTSQKQDFSKPPLEKITR